MVHQLMQDAVRCTAQLAGQIQSLGGGGRGGVPASQIAECQFSHGADAGGEVGGRNLHDEQRVTARRVRVDVVRCHAAVLIPAAHHVCYLHSCMPKVSKG